MMKIDKWSTTSDTSPFRAPEQRRIRVSGAIFGHSRYPNGVGVVTSPVVAVQGKVVRTESGSLYELGEPHPDFLAFLAGIGRVYDPVNPIKVV